jgi:hypothetical protein
VTWRLRIGLVVLVGAALAGCARSVPPPRLRLTRDGVLAGRGEHCWPTLSNSRQVQQEFSRRFSEYLRSGSDVFPACPRSIGSRWR